MKVSVDAHRAASAANDNSPTCRRSNPIPVPGKGCTQGKVPAAAGTAEKGLHSFNLIFKTKVEMEFLERARVYSCRKDLKMTRALAPVAALHKKADLTRMTRIYKLRNGPN